VSVINTGIVMGIHTSIEKTLEGRGSLNRVVHYSAMEAFAKEGNVLLFTCDRKNYTHILPDNCKHVPLFSRFVYIFLSWFIISIYANKHRLDYLYYFSGSSVFGIPFTGWLSKAKVIHYSDCLLHTSVHSDNISSEIKRWFYFRLERYVYSKLDYIIICSTEIYDFTMSSNFKGAIIPLQKSIVVNPHFHADHSTERVIWIGRLEEIKNPIFAILMWIYGGVYKEHPDAELVVIGDGSLYSTCKQMASVHGDASIRVVGRQHNIHEWLSKSSIFISTSRYESTGDAILEAMSVGLPVVALDTGGVKNIVREGSTGYLVGEDNYISFSKPVNELLSSRKLRERMGKRGQQIVFNEHDSLANSLRLIEFLKNERNGWI